MLLLPRELPDLRSQMAEFCDSWRAPLMHQHLLGQTEPGKPGAPKTAVELSAELYARLDAASFRDAQLFHINDDMVQLLMQAKDGIGQTGFMEYDLPTPVGMAYLGAELLTDTPSETCSDVIDLLEPDVRDWAEKRHTARWPERLLILWRWMPPELPEYPNGWVRVAWYEDIDTFRAKTDVLSDLNQKELRNRHGITVSNMGRFVFDGHQVIACHPDASEMRVERYDGGDTWRARRGDMFRALCFLLRQRVAETETVMPDRAAQRRAKREGKEPPPIRVISIRGAAVTGGAGDGSREWKHRWMVRGHWRRQWYRSIQAHRPVWINPFIKGPEDAPLLGGEKVYSVRAGALTDAMRGAL
jgi:hypothetical protein